MGNSKSKPNLLNIDIFQSQTELIAQELLLVHGFCRIYAENNIIPEELNVLCWKMYFENTATDKWNKQLILNHETVNIESRNEVMITHNINHKWQTVFGSIILEKGQIQEWTLKVNHCTAKWMRNDIMFGIIECKNGINLDNIHDKKTNDLYCFKGLSKQEIDFLMYNPNNRNIFKRNKDYNMGCDANSYSSKASWERDTVITMILDLTKQRGILSYKIDGKVIGSPIQNIMVDRKYCMVVAISTKEGVQFVLRSNCNVMT